MMEKKKDIVRCAIYCRKSVEKGLDMEFNSIDAQREAAEAYIASQKANGWVCLPEHYDDGGYSGGNMNRPALQKLLTDCEAGKVDVIVVYKIDRLSRSLCDFADLSRSFEKWNVAFVSVTQEINTQTSTGRMMLNILMTFAQFEREMIATRVKDKMAATRKKGKWVGGTVPLGYQLIDKKLVVNEETAPIIRRIFKRYLEIQSPITIVQELNAEGVKTVTGHVWNTAYINRILNNYTYIGMVHYDGEVFPGEQEAIIDRKTWDTVHLFLKANDPGWDRSKRQVSDAPLAGVIQCGHCNCRMTPVKSHRWGRVYYYYHCSKDFKRDTSLCPIRQVSAGEVENIVREQLMPILKSPEVIAAVSQQTGIRPKDVMHTLEDGFWNELTAVEKQQLMRIMLVLSRTAPIAEPQKQWNAPVLSRSLRDDDHYQYYQYTWLNRCKLGVLSMLITVIEDHATGLIYKNDLPRDDMRAALDLFASKLQSGNDDMEAVARLLRMMHGMALCDMPGGAEYESIGMCRRALTKWAGMKNWYWEKPEELLQHDKNNKDAVLIPHPVKKQDFWPKRDSVQPDEPEVILTLEGTLNASGKFVFTGDTIRYDAPGEHQAPSDVTIDGKPWKDLNQPFKLDFTPDFENVIIADRAGGNGVMLNRGSERAELTLFIVDAHAPAPHFVVRLVVKNVSSSRTEPARLNPSELPSGPIPFQQQLQMALERRAVLEKTIRNLELVPDFPEESIDEVRRQLRDLDRMIELLKEVVEKAAARDANEPPSPPPAD